MNCSQSQRCRKTDTCYFQIEHSRLVCAGKANQLLRIVLYLYLLAKKNITIQKYFQSDPLFVSKADQ